MSTPQLFLDCDGVLAHFEQAAWSIFGMPSRQAESELGEDVFWGTLRNTRNFYLNLPLMPDARELFDAVAHLNPIILTGCPKGGWAEPEKKAWAADHFPGTTMITCASRDKRNHMRSGDVLVDDYLKYRHRWIEAGGIFIHHTSAKQSIAELRAIGLLTPVAE